MKISFSRDKYNEQVQRERGILTDVRMNKDGVYTVTPASSPVRTHTVFYPSVAQNDNGEQRLIYNNVSVFPKPYRKDVLSILEDKELEVLKSIGTKDAKSGISDNVKDVLLVIPKYIQDRYSIDDYKKQPICVPFYAPLPVTRRMKEIAETVDEMNPDYFLYGPEYSIWYRVNRHKIESSGPDWRRIRYDVSVYEAPLSKKVRVDSFDLSDRISASHPPEVVFNEEEMAQIMLASSSLEDLYAPVNDMEVLTILQEFPINILGKNSMTKANFFVDPSMVRDFCEENNLPYVEISDIESPKETKPPKQGKLFGTQSAPVQSGERL